MIDRNSYCYDIHHTLSLKFYNGVVQIGPCCLADHVSLSSDKTIKEFWNHDYLIDLRQQNFKNTIPDACRACSNLENAGIDSRRSNHLQYYSDEELSSPGIRMLDIHLPNICNLRCTICGPHDSSSWHQDAKALGHIIKPEWQYNKDIDYGLKNLEIPDTLEYVKFWGGEPLLTKLHADFLEILSCKKVLPKTRLMYNTNGTVRVSDHILKLWGQARLIELWFSIDDLGERFEYQRFGASWNQVVDNMFWYYENLPNNHLMYISCSYSALNIWSLPDVVEWHKTYFSQSKYKDPIQLKFNKVVGDCSIDTVSPEFYEKLKKRFQPYPELLKILKTIQIENNYRPTRFLDYVTRLDTVRATDFFRTFPEYND